MVVVVYIGLDLAFIWMTQHDYSQFLALVAAVVARLGLMGHPQDMLAASSPCHLSLNGILVLQ